MGEEVDLLRQRVDQLGQLIQNVQLEAHANRDNLAEALLAGPVLGGAPDPPDGGGGPPPGGAGAAPDDAARRLIEAQKHALRSISSLPKYYGDGKISYRIFESSWKIHWEIHGLNQLNVHTQKLALLSSFVGEAIEKSRLARPGGHIFDGAVDFDQYAVAVHDLFLPPQESELSKSEFLQCVQLRQEPITSYLSTKLALYENAYSLAERSFEFLLQEVIKGIYSNEIKRQINVIHPATQEALRTSCISAVARERVAYELHFAASTSLDGLAASSVLRPRDDGQGEPMQLGSLKDVKCNGCGKMGHYVRNCRKGSKKDSKVAKKDKKDVTCYNCGDKGHYSQDCRKPKKTGGKSTQFQQNSRFKRGGYQRGGRGGTRGGRGGKQYHKELTQEEAEQYENYPEHGGEDNSGSHEFDTTGTFLEEEQGQ